MIGASTLGGKDIHVHEGIAPMDRGTIPLPYDIVVGLIGVQELIPPEN